MTTSPTIVYVLLVVDGPGGEPAEFDDPYAVVFTPSYGLESGTIGSATFVSIDFEGREIGNPPTPANDENSVWMLGVQAPDAQGPPGDWAGTYFSVSAADESFYPTGPYATWDLETQSFVGTHHEMPIRVPLYGLS